MDASRIETHTTCDISGFAAGPSLTSTHAVRISPLPFFEIACHPDLETSPQPQNATKLSLSGDHLLRASRPRECMQRVERSHVAAEPWPQFQPSYCVEGSGWRLVGVGGRERIDLVNDMTAHNENNRPVMYEPQTAALLQLYN